MRVAYLGHACFLFTSRTGFTLLTDPYDETVGYRQPQRSADVTLVSHDHWDHNYIQGVKGRTRVVQGSGKHVLNDDVTVRGVLACHDAEGGGRFGMLNMYAFIMDGVRVAYLSDLGHVLTPAQVEEVGPADVVIVPVGGHYTIDGPTAQQVIKQFPDARVVIPMHYMTPSLNRSKFPIEGVDRFLQGLRNVRTERSGEVDLEASKLPAERQILVLTSIF